nr:hypothetical transcript [Hymenolepis microstoma]
MSPKQLVTKISIGKTGRLESNIAQAFSVVQSMFKEINILISAALGGSLLPIDCIADCEFERITRLVNLVSRRHNWPEAILIAPISPSNVDLFYAAAAKNVNSSEVKAFSLTDERIVLFPVTRSIASMDFDFIPPVIISPISRSAWFFVLQILMTTTLTFETFSRHMFTSRLPAGFLIFEIQRAELTPYQMGLLHYPPEGHTGRHISAALGGSLLPIDCIADCEFERITRLVNLVSRRHNWPEAILIAPISPSNVDLFYAAAAKNVNSSEVKAFSLTDERIVLFPVTRSIASMDFDFIPPVIISPISRSAWFRGVRKGDIEVTKDVIKSSSRELGSNSRHNNLWDALEGEYLEEIVDGDNS